MQTLLEVVVHTSPYALINSCNFVTMACLSSGIVMTRLQNKSCHWKKIWYTQVGWSRPPKWRSCDCSFRWNCLGSSIDRPVSYGGTWEIVSYRIVSCLFKNSSKPLLTKFKLLMRACTTSSKIICKNVLIPRLLLHVVQKNYYGDLC